MGSVGAVGAAPVLSRDVVVAAVRDLAYVLSCCSDVSAALAGPFTPGTETWPLASGAGSASWLGGGLANRVGPGSQDGASPLAQRWCAGRGMAGGEGSGAFLFPTLD